MRIHNTPTKEKEIRNEPIQRIQTNQNRDNCKTIYKTNNYGRIPQKKNNCGFWGKQNCTLKRICPAMRCNNCLKIEYFARVCRSKQNRNGSGRINYREGVSSKEGEEGENEPEEIRYITQANGILLDNNNHYSVEMKITERNINASSTLALRSPSCYRTKPYKTPRIFNN